MSRSDRGARARRAPAKRVGDCDLAYTSNYPRKVTIPPPLRDDGEIAIVICKQFQNQHIGRRCVLDMLDLAQAKGMERVKANIYSFNKQSQRVFSSVGFTKTDEEWYGYRL